MARTPAEKPSPKARNLWKRIPLACLYLGLALGALWLGMSIPSYFRSVSPLVLEAAADGTPGMVEQAADQVGGGRAGLAKALLAAAGPDADPDRVARVQSEIADLLKRQPAYRWSGGPDPFYEQFLKQAQFLREDETHVLPTLLPRQHRETLQGFLEQSPSRNVQDILATQTLDGWDRFYPVNSTSGQPLQATILATALLEQASALPDSIRLPLLANAIRARDGDTRAMAQLEGSYVAILTLGRYFDWLQLKTLILSFDDNQQLLFAAQALQEDPERGPLLVAAGLNTDSVPELTEYLLKHGDSGWAGGPCRHCWISTSRSTSRPASGAPCRPSSARASRSLRPSPKATPRWRSWPGWAASGSAASSWWPSCDWLFSFTSRRQTTSAGS